jgi:hypothetical protein
MTDVYWHSNVIIERIKHNELRTLSGNIYILKGLIDSVSMKEAGKWASLLVKSFYSLSSFLNKSQDHKLTRPLVVSHTITTFITHFSICLVLTLHYSSALLVLFHKQTSSLSQGFSFPIFNIWIPFSHMTHSLRFLCPGFLCQ